LEKRCEKIRAHNSKHAATCPIANTSTTAAAAAAAAAATTSLTAATDNPAVSSALTEEDMNTVEKVDAKLTHMEEYWAESQSEPFPEGIQIATMALRTSLEKRDVETTPTSELSDPVVNTRHVTTLPTPIPGSSSTSTTS